MTPPSPHLNPKLIPRKLKPPATDAKDSFALGSYVPARVGDLGTFIQIKGERLMVITTKQLINLCRHRLRPHRETHTDAN
jgi:hypothetical protein